METKTNKTQYLRKEDVNKKWLVLDAEDQILGRFSSHVASLLRGKHKPTFTPNIDCGDHIIIINCELIKLTGDKMNSKIYVSHTGHPGGQRFKTPRLLMEKDPRKVIEKAVKGMLPKNRLGREMYRNLHVYAGTNHPHEAQQPIETKF